MLGIFILPYVVAQIPAGRLAELYDAKWIVTVAIAGTALINVLTPLLAESLVLLTMARIMLGICQTGLYPAGYGELETVIALRINHCPQRSCTTGSHKKNCRWPSGSS